MPDVIRTVVSRILFSAVVVACASGTSAQHAPVPIDAATREQVIDGAIEHMDRRYLPTSGHLWVIGNRTK